MCRGLMSTLFFLVLVGSAVAEVPDPDNCSVMPCDLFMGVLMCPYGVGSAPPQVTAFTVEIINGAGMPVPNAYVEIIALVPGNHQFCANAGLTGITDENGQVEMNVSGGGCTLGMDAVVISANGVFIRVYDRLISPDYSGEPDLEVSLPDFTFFGSAMIQGHAGCTDYFDDGTTGLDDFSAFGECWGRSCSP